ncbi:peptidoglycan binding domain-containing protein [Mycobacteroides abscessus subsp. bolletii]|uniref:peptidoglycan recognition protein family protein n=2 Tax=Mycobacteroides abscessus TaxID=36809 RepID=UPI0009A6EB9B|nr:N-acetylmuramoyl-L-alanine amidase [Mycobacteroides abscessus]SKT71607.1 peptidoglycan binding domain-containing protein [Mycobacteroides abscessus subsp. bolletii]
MSFVWFRPEGPLRTREQIAREVHAVSLARGLDELATVLALMCIDVEVGADDDNGQRQWWCPWNAADPQTEQFDHDSQSDDALSSGYFQQQVSRPGAPGRPWGWGGLFGDLNGARKRMTLADSADMFLAALPDDYGRAAGNPAVAGQVVQQVQKSAFPDRYAQRWGEAWSVLRRALAGGPVDPSVPTNPDVLTPAPGFRGDPYWLADVLRAEGLRVFEMDGWKDRGEGDQGVLWGAVFHHTGNANETPEGIAFHPTLGLAAHLLIRPNGDVWVCGIGKANHAGVGSWPGILTDNANPVTIGVEVAILPQENAPHRTGWPPVQYEATVKAFAAILRKLAQTAKRAISHKEWAQLGPAGVRQGKWDPGAIDMNIFRTDVQRQIDTRTTGGFLMALTDSEQREILDYVRAQNAPIPSTSPLRHLGEGNVNTRANLARAIDANQHVTAVVTLAKEGHTPSIALLWEVSTAADAPGTYPDRQEDAKLAKALLASISKTKKAVAAEDIEAWLDAEKAAA